LLCPGSPRAGRQLEPAEWARLCLFALVGGAVAAEAAFLLLAAPTALRAAGVPALAAACERMLQPLTPEARDRLGRHRAAITVPLMAGVGAWRPGACNAVPDRTLDWPP